MPRRRRYALLTLIFSVMIIGSVFFYSPKILEYIQGTGDYIIVSKYMMAHEDTVYIHIVIKNIGPKTLDLGREVSVELDYCDNSSKVYYMLYTSRGSCIHTPELNVSVGGSSKPPCGKLGTLEPGESAILEVTIQGVETDGLRQAKVFIHSIKARILVPYRLSSSGC